jgi:hypothetical protein
MRSDLFYRDSICSKEADYTSSTKHNVDVDYLLVWQAQAGHVQHPLYWNEEGLRNNLF